MGDLPDKYGRTKNLQLHQGYRLGEDGGFLNVSANAQWQNGTNNFPGYRPAMLTDRTTLLYPTLANGSLDPRETSESRYRQWLGMPSSKTYSFAYNTEVPLSPDVTLYSNGTYAWRYSSSSTKCQGPDAEATPRLMLARPQGLSVRRHCVLGAGNLAQVPQPRTDYLREPGGGRYARSAQAATLKWSPATSGASRAAPRH